MGMTSSQIVSKPAKILYVEDDIDSRTLVMRLLESFGYQVVEAINGLDGLKVARQEHPDLILMDINMPDLDGYEVTTRLRSLPGLENTPIVAVTANVMAGDRERALVAGCDGYIAKPIDVDELPLKIEAYLDGQQEELPPSQRQFYLEEYASKLVERLEEKVVELEVANRGLRKLDKMKTDFVVLAAHELRTPITLVYGYARLLMKNQVVNSQVEEMGVVTDLAHRIFDAADRLNEIVNDILNISLIEGEQMKLDVGSVDLQALIEYVLGELDPRKRGRQLTIEVDGLETLPLIPGDKARLRQVFWNLISNAVKYTDDGGLVRIEGKVTEGFVELTVTDTGIGIDLEEHEDIFSRFYVVEDTAYHSSSKTAYLGGGLGLGLTIVRGIVDAHHGQIWVESRGQRTGTGSSFHILLPLDEQT
jgi:signal transduction histidine kinase